MFPDCGAEGANIRYELKRRLPISLHFTELFTPHKKKSISFYYYFNCAVLYESKTYLTSFFLNEGILFFLLSTLIILITIRSMVLMATQNMLRTYEGKLAFSGKKSDQ